jgi:uncharacterized membrane protein
MTSIPSTVNRAPGALDHAARWAALLTGLVWLAVLSDAPAVLRVPAVLAFALAAPGMSLVSLLRLRDPLVEAMLVLAASIAVVIMVSYGMVMWGSWTTTPLLVSLTIPSLVGVVVEGLRRRPAGERK